MNTGNYDCPVCHNYRGAGSSLGQHIWAHKKKGLFTGKIDWSLRSYVKNGAAVPAPLEIYRRPTLVSGAMQQYRV